MNPVNFHDQNEKLVNFGYQRIPESQKAVRVKDHFNRIAGKYDVMNTLLSFGIHYIWKRVAVRSLALKPGESVLDACGGTGDLSVLAAKQVGPSGRVVLSDINRLMITTGMHKPTHRSARKKITHIVSDAEVMAFKGDSFDAAIMGFGIRNLTHMEKGIEEIYRLLKPGGRFVCLEFSRPVTNWFSSLYNWYSFRIMPFVGFVFTGSYEPFTYLPESIRLFPGPEEFALLLERTGFRDVTYKKLTNGIAVVHTCRKQPRK